MIYLLRVGDNSLVTELPRSQVPDVVPNHAIVCQRLKLRDPWMGYVLATLLHFEQHFGEPSKPVSISYTLLDRLVVSWWRSNYFIAQLATFLTWKTNVPLPLRALVWPYIAPPPWEVMRVRIQWLIDDGLVDSFDMVGPGGLTGMYCLSPTARRQLLA